MRIPKGMVKTRLGIGKAVGVDLEGSNVERLIVQITEPNEEGRKSIEFMKSNIFCFFKKEYTVVQ